jgi:hypothetical protein
MTARPQVLLEDDEPASDPRKKLATVWEAARGEYPTADIDRMLTELEGECPADGVA